MSSKAPFQLRLIYRLLAIAQATCGSPRIPTTVGPGMELSGITSVRSLGRLDRLDRLGRRARLEPKEFKGFKAILEHLGPLGHRAILVWLVQLARKEPPVRLGRMGSKDRATPGAAFGRPRRLTCPTTRCSVAAAPMSASPQAPALIQRLIRPIGTRLHKQVQPVRLDHRVIQGRREQLERKVRLGFKARPDRKGQLARKAQLVIPEPLALKDRLVIPEPKARLARLGPLEPLATIRLPFRALILPCRRWVAPSM